MATASLSTVDPTCQTECLHTLNLILFFPPFSVNQLLQNLQEQSCTELGSVQVFGYQGCIQGHPAPQLQAAVTACEDRLNPHGMKIIVMDTDLQGKKAIAPSLSSRV